MNTLFILLATLSPGPDFAIVSRNALRFNQRVGVMTALGVSFGTLIHSAYCILGFAVVISQSVFLFNCIKYIGASYLIYIGSKGLLEQRSSVKATSDIDLPVTMTNFHALRQGLLCTLLNPKAIMFFLAFFTIIIKPSMPVYLQVGYVVDIVVIDIVWLFTVSYFFSHRKIKSFLGDWLHYVTKISGGFLIFAGLKIAALAIK